MKTLLYAPQRNKCFDSPRGESVDDGFLDLMPGERHARSPVYGCFNSARWLLLTFWGFGTIGTVVGVGSGVGLEVREG